MLNDATLWIARRIFRLIDFVMPSERGQWVQAMEVEADYAGSPAARFSFALGCLNAAVVQRVVFEFDRNASVLSVGSAAGFSFFAHSAVQGSGAWPLLWPLCGGASAALLSVHRPGMYTLTQGAAMGFRSGFVAAVLFATAGAIWVAGSGPISLAARLPVLTAGAMLGTVMSVIGGGLAIVLARARP